MWRLVVVLVVGCNQVYSLEPTRQRDAALTETLPDGDGDGIPDVADNCPMIANSPQSDIDRDLRGDLCDECPLIASAPSGDEDKDGIGDLCDPHPLVIGDCLLLVDTFRDAAAFKTQWTVTRSEIQSTVTVESGGLVIRPFMPGSTVLVTENTTSGMLANVAVLGTAPDKVANVAAISSHNGAVSYGCRLVQPSVAADGPGTGTTPISGLVPPDQIGDQFLLRLFVSDAKVVPRAIDVSCRVDYGISVGTEGRPTEPVITGTAGLKVVSTPATISAVGIVVFQPDVACATIYR